MPSEQSTHRGDLAVTGTLSATELIPSAGCVENSHVTTDPTKRVAGTKTIRRIPIEWAQGDDDTTVVAQTVPAHICYGDATIIGVAVMAVTAPTGGDLAFTVDVQYGNESSGYATILSAPISYSASEADREVKEGTLAVTSLTQWDSLEIIVAVSGSTGTQAEGLIVAIILDENPTDP